ncbi:hypothetical protein OJAV_G00085120 [Oryzias javanicus]|uniref:BED-type domain-containing protein n=1 Tax=Oryzias javanicus TaxID=123683 RepID=A0A437CYI0_ORYJA|nr:hypothetical protein OJAV_G00085120 [Oryzias javanicus]
MEKHTKLIGIMEGKFVFRKHPDGTVDKSKVMCVLCTKEFAYHRSISSLVYHINAKHPYVGAAPASSYDANNREASSTDASRSKSPRTPGENVTPTSDKLTHALARWIATNCRPLDIVEDEGLAEVLRTASREPAFKPPCRTTVTERITEMYEEEKKIKWGMLEKSPGCVSMTGERWSSAGERSFLGVSAHFIDGDWNLNSFTLTVTTTETSHECAEQLLKAAKDWRIEDQISTVSTESAADVRALPYEHLSCSAHALHRSVSACMDGGGFDGLLSKCRKMVERLNQSPARTAELNQSPARTAELNQNPARTAQLNQSPARTAELNQSPARTAELNQSPARTAELNQNPARTAQLNQSPARTAELNQNPARTAQLNQNPARTAQLNQSPARTAELNQNPARTAELNQNPARTAQLNQQQAAPRKPCERLLQDEPTRWNSTLGMISRLLQNREAVRAALEQQNNNRPVVPTEAEWEELQRLELLLEPCRYVTELLGGEAYVSCSVVLPAFRHLNRVMDAADDDPAYVVKFKNAFQKDLAAQLADGNNSWLEVATALDPRFKDLKCLPREKREQVWARLESMLEAAETRPADVLQPIEEEPAEKRRRTVLLLGSDSDSEDDGIEFLELLRYRAEPSIDMADCPLRWWRTHSAAYEKLSALARRYLASPATCVPCERLFGLAGHTAQKRRAALPPEHVNTQLCLSDWLKHK